MITRETVEKLRADRQSLLQKAEALARDATAHRDVHREAEDLSQQLRVYTGLVEAVLDAVSVDPVPIDRYP